MLRRSKPSRSVFGTVTSMNNPLLDWHENLSKLGRDLMEAGICANAVAVRTETMLLRHQSDVFDFSLTAGAKYLRSWTATSSPVTRFFEQVTATAEFARDCALTGRDVLDLYTQALGELSGCREDALARERLGRASALPRLRAV